MLTKPVASDVIAAPGNGGMALEARCIPVDVGDPTAIVELASRVCRLCTIGPEVPLCAGAVDSLADAGILAFGPNQGGRFRG